MNKLSGWLLGRYPQRRESHRGGSKSSPKILPQCGKQEPNRSWWQ